MELIADAGAKAVDGGEDHRSRVEAGPCRGSVEALLSSLSLFSLCVFSKIADQCDHAEL